MSDAIFGRLITAMVTPFDEQGNVDYDRAAQLADYLVDHQRNDALVINGTTGESPTTSDEEKTELVRVVKQTLKDRAHVIAGCGTNDTSHSAYLCKQAAQAGADGLLIVSPYYSLPPEDAMERHFTALASTTDLPIMLYDIPHRTGRALSPELIMRLSAHPSIVAVKDAKNDLTSSARIIAESDLAYYAGDDAKILPMLSVGGVGLVGTSTHFTGRATYDLIEAWDRGDSAKALDIYQRLLPIYTGVFATQGVMLVKAGLAHRNFPVGGVRMPLLPADSCQSARFAELLDSVQL